MKTFQSKCDLQHSKYCEILWGPIIGAAVAGGISYLGGKKKNEAQISSAREQMAFQERMSNTAHQREIADLKKAGLNPILSAKYGGASTPSGAQAQITDELSPAVNSAQTARRLTADLKQVKANTVLTKKQIELTEFEKDVKKWQSTDLQSSANLKNSQTGLNTMIERLREINTATAQEQMRQLKTHMPKRKADEQFYKDAGPIMKWIDRILGAGSSAKSIIK